MNRFEMIVCLLNDAAVSIFGGVLSASFCGALRTSRGSRVFWLGMVLMLLPQGMAYLLWSAEFRTRVYPLILHLPLLVLLCCLTGKRLWPAVSILTAYLFCQLRRWLALLMAALLPGEKLTQNLAELAFTLPLLLILLRFAGPPLRQLMEHPGKSQCQFGLIPAIYYLFDYLTRVYTGLLSSGSSVVVEFMPTVCCVAYLVFLFYNSAEERRRSLLQQIQDNLKLQMAQAAREISALRESHAQAIRYRHDLRHHLQYLLSCIENSQTDRARGGISPASAPSWRPRRPVVGARMKPPASSSPPLPTGWRRWGSGWRRWGPFPPRSIFRTATSASSFPTPWKTLSTPVCPWPKKCPTVPPR